MLLSALSTLHCNQCFYGGPRAYDRAGDQSVHSGQQLDLQFFSDIEERAFSSFSRLPYPPYMTYLLPASLSGYG